MGKILARQGNFIPVGLENYCRRH